MTEGECRRTVPHVALGRLACAQGGQPYVVPVYLALHESYLYGFSSAGRKIECMRANPLVCEEIEDLTKATEWTTLVVFGTYEELAKTEEYETERILAHGLLKARAVVVGTGICKSHEYGAVKDVHPNLLPHPHRPYHGTLCNA